MNIKRTNVALGLFYSSMLVFFLGGGIAVMASVMWGPTAYHKPKMTVLLSIGGIIIPVAYLLGLRVREIWRSRRSIVGAGRGDARLAPLAPSQPVQTTAMAHGETLRLAHAGNMNRVASGINAYFLFLFVEFYFTSLYPWSLFPDYFHHQPALWLEYVYFLSPILLVVALMQSWFYDDFSREKMLVTANDDGITTQIGMRRTRFIAWADIHAFMRISGVSSNDDLSQYVLAGQHSFVTLPIQPSATFVNLYNMMYSKQITYEGGVEQYLANAQRLVATIATRGKAPMRVPHRKPRINPIIPQNLSAYALTFPLAEAPWQPTPEAVAMMATYQHEVSLSPDLVLPILRRMRRWSLWSVLFGLATFSPMMWNAVRSSSDISLAIASLIPFGIIIFTLSITACFLGARMIERSAMPSIAADAVGIRRRRGVFSGPGVSIPWQNVRAFGVILSTKMLPDPMYLLVTDTMTVALGWSEPKDAQQRGQRMTSGSVRQRDRRVASVSVQQAADRRVAYANATSALHALIVARTGLPMRDFTQP